MPTYTYQCKTCGHSHDVFHTMSAKRRIKCPKCSGACIRLIGTGAGVIFKGSGFYETDYKKGKIRGESKAEGQGTSESKTENKSESKTESKSENKTESKTENKSETKSEAKSNAKSNAEKKD